MWDKVGYLRLHRKILKNFLWEKRRTYSDAEAWIDLIIGAGWKREPVRIEGKDFINKRGCIHTTQSFLAIRWGWNRHRVSRYLQQLSDKQMISTERLGIVSVIRLLNYDELNKKDETPSAHQSEHPTEHPTEHKGDHNIFIDNEHDDDIEVFIVTAQDGVIDIGLTAKNLGNVVAIDNYIDSAHDNNIDGAIDNGIVDVPEGDHLNEHHSEHVGNHKKEEDKRKEKKEIKETNKENIASLPSTVRDDIMKFIIRTVITYLNIKSSKKHQTTSTAAINFIPERIRAGYSIDDLYMLIDYYVKEWTEGRTTAEVIHPERLFRQVAMDNMIDPEEAEGDEKAKKKRAKEIELIKQVIDYLNEKTHRVGKYAYLYATPEYQNQILARYAEKYKLEDFKHVVDVKVSEWLGDRKMETFLRPTTLFGPKFKEYVRQIPLKIPKYRQVAAGQRLSKTKQDSDIGKKNDK